MDGKTIRDIIVAHDLEKKTKEEIEKEIDSIIPFGNPAAKIRAISDHILFKKLATFLLCLEETSIQQREHIIQKIESEKTYNKVGEILLQIIDNIVDTRKVKLTGILFRNVILGKLDYQSFLRLHFIMEMVFFEDFFMLLHLCGDKTGGTIHQFLVNNHSSFGGKKLERFEELGLFNPKQKGNAVDRLSELGLVFTKSLVESIFGKDVVCYLPRKQFEK